MEYILNFNQKKMVELGLNSNDVLFLNYLAMFFSSGKNKGERIDGKYFGWITYNKILTDMPILSLGERQLKRITKKYEELGIIEKRHGEFKKLMIYLNLDLICGIYEGKPTNNSNKPSTSTIEKNLVTSAEELSTQDIADTASCRPSPPIDNNNTNKIIIKLTNARTRALSDKEDLFKINEIFYSKLRAKVSTGNFMFDFLGCRILSANSSEVELSVNPERRERIYKYFYTQLETAVHETVFEFNKKK